MIKKRVFFFIVTLNVILVVAAGTFIYFQNITHKVIGLKEAGDKVINLANTYFIPDKTAKLSSVPVEEKNFYRVDITIKDTVRSFRLTKDGESLVMPNGLIAVTELKNQAHTQPARVVLPRSERPRVELYVMSLCPYGIKAQEEILPVMAGFGDTIDFKVKFIVTTKGDTLDKIGSLHGSDEVREDARQAAIVYFYPDKLSSYVGKINESECMISCGALKLEDYWKKSAHELHMDVKKIEAYAYGQEGFASLKRDEADAKKNNVNASPTLIINGTQSDSIYQGRETIKEAVCSAFLEPSGFCKSSTGKGS